MKKLFVFFTALSLLSSCSRDDGNTGEVPTNQILSGTVQGELFTFAGGLAFETVSLEEQEVLSINLTNTEAGCEESIFDFELRISATVPADVGVYEDVNITDRNGRNRTPFNNLNQTVEITAISDTEVSGILSLNRETTDLQEGSTFGGTFTVPICE